MKIILHGKLAELGDGPFEFATDVPAEAIEGLSRQLPNWPRKMLIDAVGFDTEAKLRAPTDVDEIHLIPAMHGGGGLAKFASIIIGTAMIVAGVLLLATPFGVPLIISGATMVAMGVINLFMKAPSLGKSNDPAPSKYLPINKNTTENGTPIQLAWGRVRLAGHWLSLQSDSNNLAYGVFPGA